jgi:hypothetical protein
MGLLLKDLLLVWAFCFGSYILLAIIKVIAGTFSSKGVRAFSPAPQVSVARNLAPLPVAHSLELKPDSLPEKQPSVSPENQSRFVGQEGQMVLDFLLELPDVHRDILLSLSPWDSSARVLRQPVASPLHIASRARLLASLQSSASDQAPEPLEATPPIVH